MRIYVDESGTHADSKWLVIGMLFVPNHGALHSDLAAVKEGKEYFNRTVRKARYKETHLTEFRSARDVAVAEDWINLFIKHDCYFRSIVIEWSRWDGRHFGDPFDPDALKKRRAYKKWAEMLLQPEVGDFKNATLYLDRLRLLYGYDILDHLRMRFEPKQKRWRPAIKEFMPSDSWTDAMQCLQLADLLAGAVSQRLSPSGNPHKRAVVDYLYGNVKPYQPDSTWGAYERNIVKKAPAFSEWFWKPDPHRKPPRKR